MKQFIRWLTRIQRLSNNASKFLRKKLGTINIREVIGLNLAGAAFFGAVIVPQAQDILVNTEVYFDTQKTVVNMVASDSTYRWPMAEFGISSYFSSGHPGMDLTDPKGTPVYPIGEGKVERVEMLPWGYGKHVVVTHENNMQATYAHLSKVEVVEGQTVTKKTELGEVGNTGWATGNHLHLEIRQEEIPINPIEILPEIGKVN